MTEREYMRVCNLKSVRIMQDVLFHMNPGRGLGIHDAERTRLFRALDRIKERLSSLVTTVAEPSRDP